MFFDGNSRTQRWLLRLGLLTILYFTSFKAYSLAVAYFSGEALDLDTLGSFVMFTSFLPIGVLVFLQPIFAMDGLPECDLHLDRVFVESEEGRWLNVIAIWSLAIGFFIDMLVSAPDPASSLPSWFSPLIVGSLCCGVVIGVLRRPYRLVLSASGIDISNLKKGPIAWRDVRKVELRGNVAVKYVAIVLKNPRKYGRWLSAVSISGQSLRISSADLLMAIERRHAMFGTDSDIINPTHDLPPHGQMT